MMISRLSYIFFVAALDRFAGQPQVEGRFRQVVPSKSPKLHNRRPSEGWDPVRSTL
jgi:hypothetical protein